MNVILPQATQGQIGMTGAAGSGKYPVLWLLHGASDDHTIWMRRTSIERYVSELGLAVVMPSASLSFYQDMAVGPLYGTFIREELPAIARSFFPLSDRREDNFVAGLSMGGYGAMHVALTDPHRYAAAASLSGVLNIANFVEIDGDPRREAWAQMIFGEPNPALTGHVADLLAKLDTHSAAGVTLPKLYACCGRDDYLIEHSRAFDRKCRELSIPLKYVENEGSHDWGYWDRMIQDVLAWLPLPKL